MKFEAAAVEMPASKTDKENFKDLNARVYAPVFMYFALESLIIPLQSCDDNLSSGWTNVLEKQTPCGFCLVIVKSGSFEQAHVSINQSPTCVKKMEIQLQPIAREIY